MVSQPVADGSTGRKLWSQVADGVYLEGFAPFTADTFEEFANIGLKPCTANEDAWDDEETHLVSWLARRLDACDVTSDFCVETAGHSSFGESEGASVVTSRYVWRDLDPATAVQEIGKESIQNAVDRALEFEEVDNEDFAFLIVQYLLFTYAKGWEAEVSASNCERFSKLAESNDIGGQDFHDTVLGEHIQLKSVMAAFKKSGDTDIEGERGAHHIDGTPVVYYAYSHTGKVVFGRDHTDVLAEAVEINGAINKTEYKTCIWC